MILSTLVALEILCYAKYENMQRRNILGDDAILKLLGDGRNSELSDFSDEEDNNFQSQEFDVFLENYNNFDLDDVISDDEDVNMVDVSFHYLICMVRYLIGRYKFTNCIFNLLFYYFS